MSKTKVVNPIHIEDVLSTAISNATDKLCAEYGIECVEWYYPFDGDAENAFVELVKATTEAIEQTMSWYADDEE